MGLKRRTAAARENAMRNPDRKDAPEAQPWHADDEKARPKARRGAPIGTHSLTGGGASVGMPTAKGEVAPERGRPRDEPPEAPQPDPLAEPRANTPGVLGPRR
jgi:hypothetical protein